MEKKVGVGLIGTGVGVRTLLPGFQHSGKAEVVAISGSSADRAREVAAENGIQHGCASFREVIESDDVDLICVASPNEFHLEHAVAALESGKHVYLEKPIGSSVREAEEIQKVELLRQSDNLVVVGHQLRFNPYLRWLRSIIADGSEGRAYHLSIRQRGGAFVDVSRSWTWEFDETRGGGVRLAMGTHMLDLANFLLGSEPDALQVQCDPVHLFRTPDAAEPRAVVASNYFAAMADYGLSSALMTTSAASHTPGAFEVEVLTEQAAFFFDGIEPVRRFRNGDDHHVTEAVDWESYASRPGSSLFRKSFTYMADEIVCHIMGEESEIAHAATVADGVRSLSLLDEGLEAFIARGPMGRTGF